MRRAAFGLEMDDGQGARGFAVHARNDKSIGPRRRRDARRRACCGRICQAPRLPLRFEPQKGSSSRRRDRQHEPQGSGPVGRPVQRPASETFAEHGEGVPCENRPRAPPAHGAFAFSERHRCIRSEHRDSGRRSSPSSSPRSSSISSCCDRGGAQRVAFRDALVWSVAWIALALLFNLGLWWWLDAHAGRAVAERDRPRIPDRLRRREIARGRQHLRVPDGVQLFRACRPSSAGAR